MKTFIILALILAGLSKAYAQESAAIQEVKRLTLDNDSLLKGWRRANDSISKLNSGHKVEISILNNRIENLKRDSGIADKKMTELNKRLEKKNIELLETQVKRKSDSLGLLSDTIKAKVQQITVVKAEGAVKEKEMYNKGQQDTYKEIALTYQTNTLDYLIAHSTKNSVERDSSLIGENIEARKKLFALQAYFIAHEALEEKYNDRTVKNAQGLINDITLQSDSVKNLNERLKNYSLWNDGLKTTIGKIKVLDGQIKANNDDIQEKKLLSILSEISWYLRNYQFNFTDYPYLSDIVLDIMKLKQKDANADLTDLFSNL